ncbi:Helix-loop-helix DNA-binding domain [Musa troglodytarum]|uniref:Helix-loop-helix DNA-binding domain n=1 Tax=Musa troglodytarum TaxID=320322 RepID=A0A9E7JWW2_9LILI|nr:Helix-loop-helix DNA-binding domain [Musa troglodytarum]
MPETGSTGQGKASASSRSIKKDVIHMERSRREKMTEFYTMLQSMVPNLFPKATRTRIVDEAIAYIKGLEEVVAALEAQKAAREASSGPATLHSQRSSTVEVSASANTAFFAINFAARPGMVMKVLQVFEDHKAEVLNATIACDGGSVTVTVTASEMEEEALGKIKGDLILI